MRSLEELGRVRLSANFYMRDFLYSEIANFYGVPNVPKDPGLAIAAGSRLCEKLLEPLQATFGRIAIRSAYRSAEVTEFGNRRGYGARVECNAGYHIWDMRDRKDRMGAAACIVIPWFADRYADGADWREAGCSMCLAMNPDKLHGDEICASSSNRNFIGRQGSPTGRTLLMSPSMVAAAAIAGHVVDVRENL